MNLDRKPLPSFWFLPRDEKAAVVMTGDDHGNGGTVGRFDQYIADSPPGCVVADWECVRATSYIYPNTSARQRQQRPPTRRRLRDRPAPDHHLQQLGRTGPSWNPSTPSQLTALAANYPGLTAPTTNRTHCIAWSDWATQPKVELQNGIRLDTNYYYWPTGWVQNRPGMFTGSGMPMRFADLDGSMIDVYQAATQMTDESGQSYPVHHRHAARSRPRPRGLLRRLHRQHAHRSNPPPQARTRSSPRRRPVACRSSRREQMLTWLDGRNNSSFGSIAWSANKLTFTIDHAPGANGLRAMVPTSSAVGTFYGSSSER